jgi:hypothetical protein
MWRLRRYTEDFQLSNDAILARHMHLLNDKLESFMNDLASERVIYYRRRVSSCLTKKGNVYD